MTDKLNPKATERYELLQKLVRGGVTMGWISDEQAADMLAADAHGAEMQRFIDGLPEHEDKMFLQIEEWQRASYNHSRRQIKGQQVSRSDDPDAHLVWAALRWEKEHQDAQQVAVPQTVEPVATFNAVINFAIEQGVEAREFLDAWRHGDTSEWPEFINGRSK